jgi:hypothetical protein
MVRKHPLDLGHCPRTLLSISSCVPRLSPIWRPAMRPADPSLSRETLLCFPEGGRQRAVGVPACAAAGFRGDLRRYQHALTGSGFAALEAGMTPPEVHRATP